MQEHLDDIQALGADALGISVAAPYQAEWLMKEHIDFTLLLDPDRNFKADALGIGNIKWWTYLDPRVMWRYLKWARTTRQGKITAGPTEPPGVAIVDSDGTIRYLYEGKTLGDYPPIDTVLAEIRQIAAA